MGELPLGYPFFTRPVLLEAIKAQQKTISELTAKLDQVSQVLGLGAGLGLAASAAAQHDGARSVAGHPFRADGRVASNPQKCLAFGRPDQQKASGRR